MDRHHRCLCKKLSTAYYPTATVQHYLPSELYSSMEWIGITDATVSSSALLAILLLPCSTTHPHCYSQAMGWIGINDATVSSSALLTILLLPYSTTHIL